MYRALQTSNVNHIVRRSSVKTFYNSRQIKKHASMEALNIISYSTTKLSALTVRKILLQYRNKMYISINEAEGFEDKCV